MCTLDDRIPVFVIPIICHSYYLSFRRLVIPTLEESVKGFLLGRSFAYALDDNKMALWMTISSALDDSGALDDRIRVFVIPIICHSYYLSFRSFVIPTPEESVKGFLLGRSFAYALDDNKMALWMTISIALDDSCSALDYRMKNLTLCE